MFDSAVQGQLTSVERVFDYADLPSEPYKSTSLKPPQVGDDTPACFKLCDSLISPTRAWVLDRNGLRVGSLSSRTCACDTETTCRLC